MSTKNYTICGREFETITRILKQAYNIRLRKNLKLVVQIIAAALRCGSNHSLLCQNSSLYSIQLHNFSAHCAILSRTNRIIFGRHYL